ncbi:hypothetical protein SERLA73DRAFT_41425, partial [Serpula lacrymans var. lacrymans S7.3]
KELCQMLGIKPKLSTVFHPQTDGQMERLNQELKQYLRIFINDRQTDWAKWLKIAQFSYNMKQSSATGKAPFEVTRLYLPRMGVEPGKSKNKAAENMAKDMKSVLDETCKALCKTAEQMKNRAKRRHSKAPDYKVGDLVWLDTNHLKLKDRQSRKLTKKWIGSYRNKEVKPNVMELELPKRMKVVPTVNISHVKPYKGPLLGQRLDRPGPVVVTQEGEEEFEVERVIDAHLKRGKLEFLVLWKGYGDEDRMWEPEAHLDNSRNAVRKFYSKNPSAPRKL